MKSLLAIMLSFGWVSAAQALELTQMVAGKSRITFVSKQMGVPVNGGFSKFSAQIAIDLTNPEAGKAQVDVDLGSIDAGSSEATSEVRRKDWLNIAVFPKASFAASSVKLVRPGHYEARGPLTIKGVSRDTVVPFTLRNEGLGSWLEGGFMFPRLQFKIGAGIWGDTSTVADDIQVQFKLYLIPQK